MTRRSCIATRHIQKGNSEGSARYRKLIPCSVLGTRRATEGDSALNIIRWIPSAQHKVSRDSLFLSCSPEPRRTSVWGVRTARTTQPGGDLYLLPKEICLGEHTGRLKVLNSFFCRSEDLGRGLGDEWRRRFDRFPHDVHLFGVFERVLEFALNTR